MISVTCVERIIVEGVQKRFKNRKIIVENKELPTWVALFVFILIDGV